MRKILLVAIFLNSKTCFSQTASGNCIDEYEKVINIYLSKKDSFQNKEDSTIIVTKLSDAQRQWKSCITEHKLQSFSFTTAENKLLKSDSLYGNVIVIQFWAEWCPPCMAEIPIINRLVSEFKDRNVTFITIGNTGKTNQTYQKKFLSYFVPSSYEDIKKLGALAFPTIFIVSKKQKISSVFSGADLDNMNGLYEQLKEDILKEVNNND